MESFTSKYKKRHNNFSAYYTSEDRLTYCKVIEGLMNKLRNKYSPIQWRHFTDFSKIILKQVLLHNSNKKQPMPIAYGSNIKKIYNDLRKVFDKSSMKNIVGIYA